MKPIEHPFAVEINFTETYQKFFDAHPAVREAECLGAMFPAALSPIEQGDLLAGRFIVTPGVDKVRYKWNARKHRIAALGFLPLAPGAGAAAGYYCHDEVLLKKIEDLQPDEETVGRLHEILEFWKTETIHYKTRAAFPEKMAREFPSDEWLSGPANANCAYPLYRTTGPQWDWDKLMLLGLPGLRDEVLHARETGEDKGFYDGMLRSIQVVSDCALWYAEKADAERAATVSDAREQELLEMADALRGITEHAPKSLHEAMQLMLLYGNVSGAYSFGRMDEYLGDLYVQDVDSGKLSEALALALTQSLWQIINDNGAPFDNRIIIGGKGRRNEKNADRFAHVAIEATRTVLVPLPQLSLRFYKGQDPTLYECAMQSIGEGRTHPMLYNDDVNIPSVQNAMQVPECEAEQYLPYGCGEYVIYKKSIGTPSGIFNLNKILETVLRNGKETYTNRTTGIPLGHLRDFKTFDELFDAFKQNVEYWIEILADQQKLEYNVIGRECSYTLWNLLYENCVECGKNIFCGGIHHLGGTLESYGQINAANSLLAIKKLVYDEKAIDPDTLIAALDADFDGFEEIQQMLLDVPKYGNDIDEADTMAASIHEHACLATRAQAKRIGLDSYLIVVINNSANTILGRQTMASADGRNEGVYLANGNNPQSGTDTEGVTAFLSSLVHMRTDIHAGAVQNMKFSKELFTPRMRPKLDALLDTYWENGGSQAMITVVNRGDLEAALENPEAYSNLQVRVGGWSGRFVEMEKDVQQEILNRTFNG